MILGFIGPVHAGDDAAIIQQRAIKRMENIVEHFLRTGDSTSQANEFQQTQNELTESYNAFVRNGDGASAALSLIKLGDVLRIQNKWQDAKTNYQQGYDLAKRAGHNENQARARLGQAKAEQFSLDEISNNVLARQLPIAPQLNYSTALAFAEEAVQLSSALKDKRLLSDTLDTQGSILRSSGDFDAAHKVLTRSISAAQDSGDETKLFYGYFDRAAVNREKGYRCGHEGYKGSYTLHCPENDSSSWCGGRPYRGSYSPCYKALDEAESDYNQAIALAKKLGYTGLETMTQEKLAPIQNLRCVVTVRECREKGFAEANGAYNTKLSRTPEEWAQGQNTRIIQQCSPECLNKVPTSERFLE
ncbi:MAG: hypothetical protein FJ190_04750 [Gammaproteobacteria bacterium]|nr:hypothetical protein [Gammaproteobacteria bacterium]